MSGNGMNEMAYFRMRLLSDDTLCMVCVMFLQFSGKSPWVAEPAHF